MYIPTILAILLVACNPTDSFKNFIAIQENIWIKLVNHQKTTMNNFGFTYSNSFTTAQSQNSFGQQTTGVSIESNALKSPHILSVKTTENAQMSGKITVDGVEIKRLQGSQISFNLSPYLAKGVKKIEISGDYKPASSSVKIEFSGSSTNVIQQMSGNGTLRQTLIVTVR